MLKPLSNIISCLSTVLRIDQSISKKISFGYAVALGTAVIGTGSGLLGGYYYAQPAQIQAQQMLQNKQLLTDFNNYLLRIEMHPLRLLAIAGESRIWVQHETNQFGTNLRQINHLLEEMEQLIKQSSQPNTKLVILIKEYRTTLLLYEKHTHSLWKSLERVDDKQIATETLATALSSPTASELSTLFEKLSEDLAQLKYNVDENYNQATTQLQQVERLRLIIILMSMVISIGLAIVLAAITSRAIASPIEQLTLVARQVTQDNNFQIQASIQTKDEVFLLAKALNQLVSWSGQYTAELQEAQQTLEKRVEERTQALQQSEISLRQKADDLEDTLNELQKAQLKLIQSEKMSSLGQMIAGIAHEINNPVNFIHGNLSHATHYLEEIMSLLDLYQNSYPNPSSDIQTTIEDIDLPFLQKDFPKLMQSMQDGTTRISDIVQSLRNFSRLDESAVKQVDIHDGIDSTITILNNRFKRTLNAQAIQIIRNYGQIPKIECYAGQLNQVFMNILSNGIDALEMTPGLADPTITITTQALESGWILIDIADNGLGISETVLNRLFDPFFTTKAVGKGTGLGLSISYQIVTETHKGHLECESTLGEGAKFTIKLPVQLT